jgi:predicted DNA-binding transcriptional regulator AlpA
MAGSRVSNSMEGPAPGVYTKKELARLLQVSERQCEHLRKRKLIPEPFHIGRSVRWCRSVVDRWLVERHATSHAASSQQ